MLKNFEGAVRKALVVYKRQELQPVETLQMRDCAIGHFAVADREKPALGKLLQKVEKAGNYTLNLPQAYVLDHAVMLYRLNVKA